MTGRKTAPKNQHRIELQNNQNHEKKSCYRAPLNVHLNIVFLGEKDGSHGYIYSSIEKALLNFGSDIFSRSHWYGL